MAEFPAYDQDLKCLPKFFLKVEVPLKDSGETYCQLENFYSFYTQGLDYSKCD